MGLTVDKIILGGELGQDQIQAPKNWAPSDPEEGVFNNALRDLSESGTYSAGHLGVYGCHTKVPWFRFGSELSVAQILNESHTSRLYTSVETGHSFAPSDPDGFDAYKLLVNYNRWALKPQLSAEIGMLWFFDLRFKWGYEIDFFKTKSDDNHEEDIASVPTRLGSGGSPILKSKGFVTSVDAVINLGDLTDVEQIRWLSVRGTMEFSGGGKSTTHLRRPTDGEETLLQGLRQERDYVGLEAEIPFQQASDALISWSGVKGVAHKLFQKKDTQKKVGGSQQTDEDSKSTSQAKGEETKTPDVLPPVEPALPIESLSDSSTRDPFEEVHDGAQGARDESSLPNGEAEAAEPAEESAEGAVAIDLDDYFGGSGDSKSSFVDRTGSRGSGLGGDDMSEGLGGLATKGRGSGGGGYEAISRSTVSEVTMMIGETDAPVEFVTNKLPQMDVSKIDYVCDPKDSSRRFKFSADPNGLKIILDLNESEVTHDQVVLIEFHYKGDRKDSLHILRVRFKNHSD